MYFLLFNIQPVYPRIPPFDATFTILNSLGVLFVVYLHSRCLLENIHLLPGFFFPFLWFHPVMMYIIVENKLHLYFRMVQGTGDSFC